jgi:hypothetical protein
MAHPFHEHRQTKKEHSRVHHITKGYAHGGAVKAGAIGKEALTLHKKEHAAIHAEGHESKHRMDRPKRAKGGRVGKKSGNSRTIVNVITGGHPAAGAVPPGPPTALPPPMGVAPGGPPMGARPPMPMPPPGAGGPPGAPPMPMRAKGGRVNQGSPVFEEGKRAGTKVQHSDGHATANKNLGRGRVVTFKCGGAVKSFRAYGGRVESPQGVAKATKLPGGGGGGEARLVKAHHAGREYHGPD